MLCCWKCDERIYATLADTLSRGCTPTKQLSSVQSNHLSHAKCAGWLTQPGFFLFCSLLFTEWCQSSYLILTRKAKTAGFPVVKLHIWVWSAAVKVAVNHSLSSPGEQTPVKLKALREWDQVAAQFTKLTRIIPTLFRIIMLHQNYADLTFRTVCFSCPVPVALITAVTHPRVGIHPLHISRSVYVSM